MLMATESTAFGIVCQPYSVGRLLYRIRMSDTKKTIWANYCRVMSARHGVTTKGQLAKKAGFAPATATRLTVGETDFGIDKLEGMADAAKVQPWQLLIPDMDPKQPPQLVDPENAWPLQIAPGQWRALPPESQNLVHGYIGRVVEEQDAMRHQLSLLEASKPNRAA